MRETAITLPDSIAANLESFISRERMSSLFNIEALVLCDDEGTDFYSVLGEPVAISVYADSSSSPLRYFHGQLYECEYLGISEAGHRYRLVLRPWVYPLTHGQNFKIFQNQSAVDIIKSILDAAGGSTDFTNVSTRKNREYCVQYRESDFAFISRLLEEEGIYYHFSHKQSQHTMVFCDGPASHSGDLSLPYVPPQADGRHEMDSIWKWSERVSTMAVQKVTVRNFDFVRPQAPQETDASGTALSADKAVLYEFPAPAYASPDDGLDAAQRRIDGLRSEQRLYVGECDAPGLACGAAFSLTSHPIDRFDGDYIVLSMTYSLSSQTYRSGGQGEAEDMVVFEAVPKANGWRPPLAALRPVARGPETATVVGPTRDDVYTDKYGRVKVAFHWDMAASANRVTPSPDPTCWIRVSASSAGAEFGHIALPRVGQEVIVDFLDGDPDRPIITGRVYNAAMMPPYTLPDNKTRSVWRSRTIGATGASYDEAENPPGTGPGSNEIRMEDKSAAEELYVHAQRAMTTWVRLDEDHKVGRDQTRRVGRNRTTNIKKNDTTTVETGDVSYTVQQGKRTETVQQNDSLTVQQGDKSVTVSTGNYDTTVSTGNLGVTVSTGNHSTTVSLGNLSVKCDAGSVSIEAMQQIELKVGANSIVIDQTGVTVKGMMIKQQATVQWSAQGAMAQLEADAMTTVKGAIVMIN